MTGAASNAPRGRIRLFRLCAVVFGLAIGLLFAEAFLRWRVRSIARSDHLSSGMVLHDPLLGWRLTPDWRGRHTHHDFKTEYRIDSRGFRADTDPGPGTRPLYALVGDSFTFGLGVADHQTFAHLLNNKAGLRAAILNCGVPGYSTDQEALFIEKVVLRERPQAIVLFLYLANDLFDNQLPIAMQVRAMKPFFQLGAGGLSLKNTPVPKERPPVLGPTPSLFTAVLGEDAARHDWRIRLEQRSEVFKLVNRGLLPQMDHTPEFESRLLPALDLGEAILSRMALVCATNQVQFTLALLAGRSFVAEPGSISAQFQDYLRKKTLDIATLRGWRVLDLANRLRQRKSAANLYFPNDGHLNPEGHRVVAEILAAEILPAKWSSPEHERGN